MAKKSIWIDNTRPPTNYIWAKTDLEGNIIGVYEWNGSMWVKIASENTGISPVTGDGVISAVTLNGETVQLVYSISPYPGSVVVRTDKGTILSNTPEGNDPQEVITVELMSWNQL
jgi:hypothetical protein